MHVHPVMRDKWMCLLLLLAVCSLCVRSAHSTPSASLSNGTTATKSPEPAPSFCKSDHATAYALNDTATTMSWAGNMLKAYHNLYHHNKKWYAVLDNSSDASSIDAGVSANTVLVKLPTTDATAFQDNIKICYVPGVTLYIDFPFPAFPDNLGHWAELLLPMYSVFSNPQWRQHLKGEHDFIDRVLLANVRPEILYNWPKEMLALALDPALPPWPAATAAASDTAPGTPSLKGSSIDSSSADSTIPTTATGSTAPGSTAPGSTTSSSTPNGALPPGAVPWDKPLPKLLGEANVTGWCKHGWMLFENLLVVQDRYHIVSLPDRQLPRPPESEAAAAAASHRQCDVAGQQSDPNVRTLCDGQFAAVPSESAAAAKPSAAAPVLGASVQQQVGSQGFWNSKYQVGFSQPGLAAQFRAAAHARQLWGSPVQSRSPSSSSSGGGGAAAGGGSNGSGSGNSKVPLVVTVLLYPEDYPPVVNHYALVDMLRDLTQPYGFKVRTVSLTMGAPFLSHMATVADTGILIARHGPLLATAMLLPPGAAVLELLPYKWEWRGVSRLFFNMTQSTGYLHHWAWRPLDAKWCKYKDPAHARYSGWTTSECQGRECLLFHAQAGLEVDLQAVRELLAKKLPGLLAEQSVKELAEPWPPAE